MIHEKTMPMYGVTHMIEAKDRKDMKKDRQGWFRLVKGSSTVGVFSVK